MSKENAKKSIPAGDKSELISLARGDCYNPQCTEPIITKRAGRPIVNFEIAHIRDELQPNNPGSDIGWRFWPAEDLTQDKRNHFDNLILLCSACHKLIDKIRPRDYTVELLQSWKTENESSRSEPLAHTLGAVATPQQLEQLEQRLINKYISELYIALSSQPNQIIAATDGGDTFPLAEFPSMSSDIDSLYPSFTAVGNETLTNVAVEVDLFTSNGKVRGYLNDQTFPILRSSQSKLIWISEGMALPISVNWKTLRRIEVSFWTANRHFHQLALYNPINIGNRTPNMMPTLVEVHRVHSDGSRILVYRREIIQLIDGQVCITKNPVVRCLPT